jgi:hypothetical protein
MLRARSRSTGNTSETLQPFQDLGKGGEVCRSTGRLLLVGRITSGGQRGRQGEATEVTSAKEAASGTWGRGRSGEGETTSTKVATAEAAGGPRGGDAGGGRNRHWSGGSGRRGTLTKAAKVTEGIAGAAVILDTMSNKWRDDICLPLAKRA